MKEQRRIGLEDEAMILVIERDADRMIVRKPKDEGRWMDHYTVEEDNEGKFSICVKWDKGGPPCPVVLMFSSDEGITGVGFSECKESIERYTSKGPCGGCFFLCSDLTGGQLVAVVKNWGHQRENRQGYHFALWLVQKRIELDPQIYNDGVIHDPDGKPRKKGVLGPLRRLVAYLWG